MMKRPTKPCAARQWRKPICFGCSLAIFHFLLCLSFGWCEHGARMRFSSHSDVLLHVLILFYRQKKLPSFQATSWYHWKHCGVFSWESFAENSLSLPLPIIYLCGDPIDTIYNGLTIQLHSSPTFSVSCMLEPLENATI